MMKDELSGTLMSEFVGARSKSICSFERGWRWSQSKEKLKGIQTNIVKNKITLLDYNEGLFRKLKNLSETQYTLRANKHRMFFKKENKKALHPNDTKRNILKNEVNTVLLGFTPLKL